MNSINNYWPAPNIWVFRAQLVEHCRANAEAVGSNPVEALKFCFRLKFAIASVAITTAMVKSSISFYINIPLYKKYIEENSVMQ